MSQQKTATVGVEPLRAALAKVRGVCASKSTLPVLGMVLIRARATELEISANNLDLALTVTVGATVQGEWALAVPGARLAAALGKMQCGKEVRLALARSALCMSSEDGDYNMRLLGLEESEFPPVTEIPPGGPVDECDGCWLGKVLGKALAFVSDDDTRYVLNGVHFHSVGDRNYLAATDGRRLFKAELDGEEFSAMADSSSGEAWTGYIVPTPAVKVLASLLSELVEEDPVRLRFSEQSMEAEAGSWRLSSKLIEGNFPNIAQVIPAPGAAHQLTLPRDAFLAALPFVETLCSKANDSVTLEVLDSKTMVVTVSQPDVGEAVVKLHGELTGGELKVCYSGPFLVDMVGIGDGEKVTLEMADAMSPARCGDARGLSVLMPKKIN